MSCAASATPGASTSRWRSRTRPIRRSSRRSTSSPSACGLPLRTETATAGLRRVCALLTLVGGLLGLAPAAAATGAVPAPPTESPNAVREVRVLLMYAEDRLAPAFVAQDEAFRSTLQSGWPGP